MRPRVRARPLLTLVYVTGCLALPAAASASGNSPVHVDPKSPVAKEYALPLASARGAAPESGNSGKLFGPGIKHHRSTATRASTTPASMSTTAQAPAAQTQSTQAPAPVPVPVPQAVAAPTVAEPAPTTTEPPPAISTHATTTAARTPPQHVTTVSLPALTRTDGGRAVKAAPAAYTVLEPGSGSGVLWMVLAAVIVVALGSAGGVMLSRRR